MDIGCGHGLVSFNFVRVKVSILMTAQPVTFGTANGYYEAGSAVELTIHHFKRNNALPHVLKSTPSVIGKRCVQNGF